MQSVRIILCVLCAIILAINAYAQEGTKISPLTPQYSVKLIPFPDKDKAEKEVSKLTDLGFKAFLKEDLIDGTKIFVVTVGDFSNLEDAKRFLQDFIDKTQRFAFITRYNSNKIIEVGELNFEKQKPKLELVSKKEQQPKKIETAPSPPKISALSSSSSGSIDEKIAELEERLNKLQQEAEARKSLQITEEEQKKKEERILEAAGREYLLMPKGRLGFEYALGYSYYSYDVLEDIYSVEHHANHSLRNTLTFEYSVLNNLTLNLNVPFVYKFDKIGTDREKKVTDIGDISFGAKFQPFKNTGKWPAPILSTSLIIPTGRGTYHIDPESELSTGGSLVGLSTSVSISKPVDPVNVFASLGYTHYFKKEGLDQKRGGDVLEEVDPGGDISGSLGLGYALSYNVSMSLSYSYSYSLSSKYYFKSGRVSESGTSVSSSLALSTGWYITPKRSVIVGVGMGLTNNDSDFTFSLRIPFEYSLVK